MSRRSDQGPSALRRRPSRPVPALIVALALLTIAVTTVWLSVLRLASGAWPGSVVQAANWAQDVSWGSTTAIAAASGVAVIGVVLLLCAIIPGRYSAMRIRSDDLDGGGASTELVMPRGSVARLAAARAAEVVGVGTVSTSAGDRSVSLSVTTRSDERESLGNTVKQRVGEALQSAGIDPLPRISVNVRTRL